jgi:hypothetical protein
MNALKLPTIRFKFPFKKLSLSNIHRKKTLLISGIVLGLLLLAGGLAGAFFVYKAQQKPMVYELALDPQDQLLINKSIEVKASVTFSQQSKLSFSQPVELALKARLDDKEIHTSTVTVDKNTTTLPATIIPIDGTLIEEGAHVLKVELSSVGENTQVFDTEERTIIVDRTSPTLIDASSEKGYLSRYEIKDNDSTTSAKNGLKLISNSKEPIALTLSLSEQVSGDNVATEAGTLEFSGAPSATIAATLTAVSNQFTTPFIFNDMAGNKLVGELNFVYDGQAPKINVYTDYRVDTNAVDTYFFRFTTTEPMAWVKGTMNGVTKTAVGTYQGYRIDGLPLTQEKNIITLVGQDLAGNQATAEAPVTIVKLKTYSGFNFGNSSSLPENVRLCTPEDEKACGYSHDTVGDLSCEEFKVVKDCLHNRCSRSGYALGSCTY